MGFKTADAARSQRWLSRWRQRPGATADPRHGGQLRELARGDGAAGAATHGDRALTCRSWHVGRWAGDYSLGNLATGLRDLLLALGHERATLVGHSLGGGIAMQFAYQFPEMVERLVLFPAAASGPRSVPSCGPPHCPAPTSSSPRPPEHRPEGRRRDRARPNGIGMRPGADIAEVARGYTSLSEPRRRKAFLATLRSVVGSEGAASLRHRPPLSRRRGARTDHLGRPRPDHPRAPRRRRPRERCPGSRAGDLRGCRPHAPARAARATSSPCSNASSPRTSPPSSIATSGGPGSRSATDAGQPEDAPDRIRTCGLRLRRAALYPAELRALRGQSSFA